MHRVSNLKTIIFMTKIDFMTSYTAPTIRVVEFEVEQGFSLSNADVTLPDFEDENAL